MTANQTPLFSLGKVVATPGALEALKTSGEIPEKYLRMHITGNFGDLYEDDVEANQQAIIHCSRIMSAYHLKDGTKIWIITEADRSSTCILLPEEY